MLLTADAGGVYPIAPTPFFEDGRIDTASIDRLTDFYMGIGATGVTVLGQLGEAPKLKHEDWPGLEKITTLRGWEREGALRHIASLCGNGGLFLDYEMERGADGAHTGCAFPDMLCDLVRLSQDGQRKEAHDLFDAHLPLLRYEQQPGGGLAVRK